MARLGSTHHFFRIVFSFVYMPCLCLCLCLCDPLCANLQLPSMARVSCSHHVLGVEHLLSELGHRARSVLRVAPAVEKLFVIAKSDFCRDHDITLGEQKSMEWTG